MCNVWGWEVCNRVLFAGAEDLVFHLDMVVLWLGCGVGTEIGSEVEARPPLGMCSTTLGWR